MQIQLKQHHSYSVLILLTEFGSFVVFEGRNLNSSDRTIQNDVQRKTVDERHDELLM